MTASSSRYLVKGNSIELRIYFPSGYSSASESFRAAQWLAPHAIRLKKNITLYSGPTSRPWIDSETVSDETLVLIMGNTERTNTPNHFSSSEMIKLPGEAINIKDMYRRCFKPPTQAEKILFTFKDLKGLPIAYISNTQCAIVCLWEGLSRGTETTDLSKTRKEYMDYVLVNFSERHGKMIRYVQIEYAVNGKSIAINVFGPDPNISQITWLLELRPHITVLSTLLATSTP